MDQTDIQITELLKGNARTSCQNPGDKICLSRVAAGYIFFWSRSEYSSTIIKNKKGSAVKTHRGERFPVL